MADFKDVVLRLQENKNDNRQAFVEQTQELSKVFAESIKTQNRSFGQSLALQSNKTNQTLTTIASTLQGLQSVFTADMKADKDFIGPIPEGQEQNINSLTSIYDVLVSIDTNLKENIRRISVKIRRHCVALRQLVSGQRGIFLHLLRRRLN